jgi:hypothetical protein
MGSDTGGLPPRFHYFQKISQLTENEKVPVLLRDLIYVFFNLKQNQKETFYMY